MSIYVLIIAISSFSSDKEEITVTADQAFKSAESCLERIYHLEHNGSNAKMKCIKVNLD